jgi:hypothetical protein
MVEVVKQAASNQQLSAVFFLFFPGLFLAL